MRFLRRGGAAALGLLAAGVTMSAPPANAAAPRRISLILDYRVTQSCQVFPNYPNPGVKGNQIGWTISPGDIVSWRYNVNGHWAMISDKKFEHSAHPWWGFTPRQCIGVSVGGEHFPTPTSVYPAGRPIPSRILQGRSAVVASHFRAVDFQPAPGHVINAHKLVTSLGTIRDARGRFVLGNVVPGWHVQQTDEHAGSWTKVYVPNAKRWGWVEDWHFLRRRTAAFA